MQFITTYFTVIVKALFIEMLKDIKHAINENGVEDKNLYF